MTSKKQHAVDLARQGFRIFPLIPNGKTPVLEGNWRNTASDNPDRVAEMWTCPVTDAEFNYNIGIALDRKTLVVDVDVREGRKGKESLNLLEAIYDELPATLTVNTASGGEHRYFRAANSAAFAKTLTTNVDLKGEGGYVVAPGSIIDGKEYTRSGFHSGGGRSGVSAGPDTFGNHFADVPDWVVECAPGGTRAGIGSLEGEGRAVVAADSQTAIARAIDWLASKAPEAIEGANGDATTIKVANRVGDFGISAGTALNLLLDHWNDTKAQPPWDPDDLAEKVRSAFKSRQNPVGIASAEAEFDAVEVDTRQPPKRRGLYFTTWKDAKPNLDQPYLIDGILDMATMAVTYGDSNTGKTYVKLDQAFHIAAGIDWNGHKVKQGAVVYIAAEGGSGFAKRIEAFKRHYSVMELPFAIVPCPVDLFSENGDTAKLLKLIRDVEAVFDQKTVLIVVDTLARAMAGGDENTSADMGKFVRNCDKLRDATGATVNIIHHTGKDKAKGARGSSALRAATDTEIEIDVGVLTVTKQRDMARAEEMHFELDAIEIGQRADGKAVTACTVRWVAASEFEARVSPAAAEMFAILERLVDAKMDEIEDDSGVLKADKADIKIEWGEWQMSALSCLKGARGKGISRTTLFGLRRELSENGMVHKDKLNQWFIK